MIHDPKYRNRTWPHHETAMDIEIFDIGFINIQGACKKIESTLDVTAEAIYRKALI